MTTWSADSTRSLKFGERSRSALLREGAQAVITADERMAADRRLVDAYRRIPEDPVLTESAARLAAHTVPEW